MTIEEGVLTEDELVEIDGDYTRKVVDFLGKKPGNVYTSENINEKTEIGNNDIVSSILTRLEKEGVVRRRFEAAMIFYGIKQ